MTYAWLLLMSSKHHSPRRRSWYLIVALANSTFEASLFQNNLLTNHYDASLSARNKWLLWHTEGLINRAPTWYLSSSQTSFLISIFLPLCHRLTNWKVSFSWLQCLQSRDPRGLPGYGWYPRTDMATVEWPSHRWWPDVGERSHLFSTSILVSTKITVDARSWYYWFRKLSLL